ncbi:hypothetical protein [Streptomyces sp. NPDC088785]|uniref:hypothetical protein n=1 Tax=Streptomyces sp. NPDC088785 TaxID=3365897 RepID=UPI00380FA9F4
MRNDTDGARQGGFGAVLRRFKDRFEPAIVRTLPAVVHVTGLLAQFVRPLGDALEGSACLGGALLGLVGYVLADTSGPTRRVVLRVMVPDFSRLGRMDVSCAYRVHHGPPLHRPAGNHGTRDEAAAAWGRAAGPVPSSP